MKRFWLSVFFVSLSCSSVSLYAQQPRLISVIGEGEVKAVPDQAIVDMSVSTEGATAEEAKAKNDKITAMALRAAKDLGIEDRDIQTASVVAEPRYDYPNQVRQISGYDMNRSIHITLRNVAKLDELLSNETKVGVNVVGQTQFQLSDLKAKKAQARTNAIKDAKEKAQQLARDLGVQVGKAYSISEQTISQPVPMFRAMSAKAADGGDNAPVFSLGEETIEANIYVQFELIP